MTKKNWECDFKLRKKCPFKPTVENCILCTNILIVKNLKLLRKELDSLVINELLPALESISS